MSDERVPGVRALAAADGASARGLVHGMLGGTRYLARALELVGLALTGADPEFRGLVLSRDGGAVDGLLLYGLVGGAAGVIRLHGLWGNALEPLTVLISAAVTVDLAATARMFVCELAASSENTLTARALIATGFTCEASIGNYFTDAIALQVFVLRMEASTIATQSLDQRDNPENHL